ncbi:glyoxalase [Janthinobacterium sp. ROICE36]|uniref:VOC family protein n=1 Tax=Janthinobacterium sp. ROICE36 TaxID=2048670 RepID=UPI000C7E8F6C|nr:VOC family protein [Janthinobacterium sp. ROICE36]PLY40174.1 glyoxalase [Janthinobacterium sp. ROICE36]
MKSYLRNSARIDHIAIAVRDLDEALFLYQEILGFELVARREVKGAFSGMISAELKAGGFSIVLVQGTDPQSQVSRYIAEFGPGVQHVAIEVEDVASVEMTLRKSGLKFATEVIRGSNLVQIFTRRDSNCGMMFEFIQRVEAEDGFETVNIQKLFEQLEESNAC